MAKTIDKYTYKDLKSPDDLKKLSYSQLKDVASSLREEIIRATSLYGGHLSSNLGVVELTISLFRSFSFPKDKLILDVGHQCYAEKLLTGRSLENLNQEGATSGFQKLNESPYDCYEAGHSGTSLSAALGFAVARDLRKENYDVVAVTGDASIVNGLAFEALNDIGNNDHKVIVILNDNGMSISKPTGGFNKMFRKISLAPSYNKLRSAYRRAFTKGKIGEKFYLTTYHLKTWIKSKLVRVNMFDDLGFSYYGPVDGHDMKALEKAFTKAKKVTKPIVIHVLTKKGKGYSLAEDDEDGYWHGVTPFDVKTGKPLNMHPTLISWSNYMGQKVTESMKKYPDTFLICPAMKKGSHLEEAFNIFPERSKDVGISEEHALTLAGALALNGFHPIVSIYSTFLQRAYDELSHDCARLNIDLTLLIDRAGLVGTNGDTHQGIYDETFLKSIPNVTITQPSTFQEADFLLEESFKKGRGIFAIRYPHSLLEKKQDYNETLTSYRFNYLTPFDKNKPTVIAIGDLGRNLFNLLDKNKYNFIDPLYLFPLNEEDINLIKESPAIYIYDAYGTINGFSETLLASLLLKDYHGKAYSFSLPLTFVNHGSFDSQLHRYNLRAEEVKEEILKTQK